MTVSYRINLNYIFLSGDALEQSFVFSSLDNAEKQMLANAMEQVEVHHGEDLIRQGSMHYTALHCTALFFSLLLHFNSLLLIFHFNCITQNLHYFFLLCAT